MINIELTKAMVRELNNLAQEDFDRAQAMLDGVNMLTGGKYGWLSMRVIVSDDISTIPARYSTAHDAYFYAKE